LKGLFCFGVEESAMTAEAAEKWKHMLKWDEASDTIVFSPDWWRAEWLKIENEVEHKELMAYTSILEKKRDDAWEKHWNAFKLRPEVDKPGDLSAEEVVRLEKKWNCKGLICYDAQRNDIIVNPTIHIWDNGEDPYGEHSKEIAILQAILKARVDQVEAAQPEQKLSQMIDQLIEDWGPFLDTRIPKGYNAKIIRALQERRHAVRSIRYLNPDFD